VLSGNASAFGHPFVAATGDANRDNAPDRRIERKCASVPRDLIACRWQQAQPCNIRLGLDLEVLGREVAHEFKDISGVFLDPESGVIGYAIGGAPADEPP
jgi:hypothetical protein